MQAMDTVDTRDASLGHHRCKPWTPFREVSLGHHELPLSSICGHIGSYMRDVGIEDSTSDAEQMVVSAMFEHKIQEQALAPRFPFLPLMLLK